MKKTLVATGKGIFRATLNSCGFQDPMSIFFSEFLFSPLEDSRLSTEDLNEALKKPETRAVFKKAYISAGLEELESR